MDRHTCKLCFRRFHNGRALGGHMRSHVMAAASSPPISIASTSSTNVDDRKPTGEEDPVSCVVRDGRKKRFVKVGAPEFSGGVAAGGESSVVQDGQSDTESSPRGGARFVAASRRRSKRERRRAPPDPEPASSVSDATPEDQDVAMSLVMLSRDSWTRSRSARGEQRCCAPASSEPEQSNANVGSVDGAGDEDDGDVALRPRGRFRCGACRKGFRSYQALVGHRASVRQGKGGCVPAPVPLPTPSSKASRADVAHECPFCFRVFGSGQVLGGHKRAHLMASSPSPAKRGDSSGPFDLNVPPAVDDDFELSAVYDVEFGCATGQ